MRAGGGGGAAVVALPSVILKAPGAGCRPSGPLTRLINPNGMEQRGSRRRERATRPP